MGKWEKKGGEQDKVCAVKAQKGTKIGLKKKRSHPYGRKDE